MNEAEYQKKMENPRIKRFVDSGDELKVSLRISMAYTLLSVSKTLQEEAEELLDKHGLVLHSVKLFSGRLEKAFDQYHNVLKTMIPSEVEKKNLIEDVSVFNDLVEHLMEGNITVKRGKYCNATVYLPEKKEVEL